MSKVIESRVEKIKDLERRKDPALESWRLLFPEEAAVIKKAKLEALSSGNDEAVPDDEDVSGDETAPDAAESDLG